MKLAIDAMGGDYAPLEIVKGVYKALESFDIDIILLGNKEQLSKYLINKKGLTYIYTTEVITNNEAPVAAIRKKKDSSMAVGIELLKEGKVDAFLSAGNTGALMAGSLLKIGRIKGIDRPALAPILPTINGATILLDAGSNTDCKPINLLQFAAMGCVYAQKMFNIEKPRVGLFNIGAEEEKGNELTKQAYDLIKNSDLNFVGNVEGRDIAYGAAEVVTCDGFVGNAILKSMEGTASVISLLLKQELKRNLLTKFGTLFIMSALKNIVKKMDYTEYGGAPLLGIRKPVIKAHGSSKSKAIFNAIRQAKTFVEMDVLSHIEREIELIGDDISASK
ncbi:phosphate acyltransferase PlsX [Thermoanaerobacterium sp. RBIITD]|uniref:phosphate acyltransferase PlsX n=1 Tax=Thermoanaerobacterium sp. RBIITD TaxID=1550240 RepID=UPI000BB9AB8B|nr:phosphate acyltransferase PlsX [Thermoanaerobacterium sp. RBIITD]SNX55568.1 phosphate:acyl-[acyl carrier protein] acyltransferase [Thermoanaerobacterium sp. RBIITD]